MSTILQLKKKGKRRHRVDGSIKKQDPTIYCLPQTHFSLKDTCKFKLKERKKVLHASRN